MRRYRFVVGVSLPVLEEEVNRLASLAPDLRLLQVLYAAGTGFVGVVEEGTAAGPLQEPEPAPAPPAPAEPIPGAKKRAGRAGGARKG